MLPFGKTDIMPQTGTCVRTNSDFPFLSRNIKIYMERLADVTNKKARRHDARRAFFTFPMND